MRSHVDNTIVVGIDGSNSSTAAALWAADEAQRREAQLRLVGAHWVHLGFAGPGVVIPPDLTNDVREAVRDALNNARDLVSAAHPNLDVAIELRHQEAFTALTDAAEYSLMAVVGSNGEHEVTESLLGSVALKMASRSSVPVVVVRANPDTGSARSAGPVLVGLDGSPGSDQALSFAFEEASMRDKQLIALHSWNENALKEYVWSDAPEVADDAELGDEKRLLAEQLSGWSDKYPDVPVSTVIRRGHPGATILRYCQETEDAERPSLLVVGSRGHGGFVGLLLGSTSQALIAHATCPVAVVRHEESTAG